MRDEYPRDLIESAVRGKDGERRAPVSIAAPETERLRLRQWLPRDFAPFAALNADPRVAEHLPGPLSRAESDALALRLQALIEEQGWGFWAAELKVSGDLIGFVGLGSVPAALPFAPGVEVGWRLAHRFWGRGYATEAARAALGVGFRELGLDEVLAYTAVRNGRSRALMARLGMAEAPPTFPHPALPAGHPVREHCLYRLPRAAWLASETGLSAASALARQDDQRVSVGSMRRTGLTSAAKPEGLALGSRPHTTRDRPRSGPATSRLEARGPTARSRAPDRTGDERERLPPGFASLMKQGYHQPMIDWTTCIAVERDPERVSGAWVFRGTRVPVAALFENLEDGAQVGDFVEWFPGVTLDQARAVLEHAARSLNAA
jgi:RimJ/RimL family protein N-acetyltransferase/uncharacterized protein (DUF433 family)